MSRAKGPTQRYTWPRILLASLVLLTLFLGSATYRIRNRDEVLPVQVRSSERWLPYRMEDRTAKRGDQHRPKLNDTFGFERIYLLNLASRRDRRSEMQLLMSQYNMAYTLVEGVSGAKEKPSYTQAKEQRQHGRAQGHAKIWQQMLQERASSALILEDNFDMDRRIREQMERLQEPFAVMLNIMQNGRNHTELSPSDPWNTALWDMLWFGQCSEQAWAEHQLPDDTSQLPLTGLPFLTYNDPARSKTTQYSTMFDEYKVPRHDSELDTDLRLRIIQPAREARCTTAYALTRSGAARALYQNTHKGWLRDLDLDLITLVREGRLRAFTVSPPFFNHRVAPDGSDNDGELKGDDRGHSVPVPGVIGRTEGIDDSARQHLFDDILGDDLVFVRQIGR